MSSVRMCDVCGSIFSESEPGWQTGRVATIVEDGIQKVITQDRCPECAIGVKGMPKVRPRIGEAPKSDTPTLPSGSAPEAVNPATGETPSR
jgi:rubredoxin